MVKVHARLCLIFMKLDLFEIHGREGRERKRERERERGGKRERENERMNEWCIWPDSALVRLYWAGDKLG